MLKAGTIVVQGSPASLLANQDSRSIKSANVKQGILNFARWCSGEDLPFSSTKAEQTACAGMLK